MPDNTIPVFYFNGTLHFLESVAEGMDDMDAVILRRKDGKPRSVSLNAMRLRELAEAARRYDDLRAEVLYSRDRIKELEAALKPTVYLHCDKGGN